VGDDVWAPISDVLSEKYAHHRIVRLHSSVAASHSISAEHYQIASDVIARMLEHVMKGEADPGEIDLHEARLT
jgi:hypothetical protein